MYGDCEELLGKWFQRTGKRSEVRTPRQIVGHGIKNTVFTVWTDLLDNQVWKLRDP